jgi:hypothetical protein
MQFSAYRLRFSFTDYGYYGGEFVCFAFVAASQTTITLVTVLAISQSHNTSLAAAENYQSLASFPQIKPTL